MKKLISLFLLLNSIVVYSQHSWPKSSPLDYQWMYVGNAGFSLSNVGKLRLVLSETCQPFVAYTGYLGDTPVLKAMTYDGIHWDTIGAAINYGFQLRSIDLAINNSGELFLAYVDGWPSILTILKYNGISWEHVGPTGFAPSDAGSISLIVNDKGEPLVGCIYEVGSTAKAMVMKFDGINWTPVGGESIVQGELGSLKIAFDPTGILYLAYSESAGKASVMKYNGNTWEYVGEQGISAGKAFYLNLACSPVDSQPYIAYQDMENSRRTAVKRFDGYTWINVGEENSTPRNALEPSFAISPEGKPYIAFFDDAYFHKASVMDFDGSAWNYVGGGGFTQAQIASPYLAIGSNGTPILAFRDLGYSQRLSLMKYDSTHLAINDLKKPTIIIYPNPAHERVTIKISDMTRNCDLTIFDDKCQTVLSCRVSPGETLFDVSTLPAGLYLIKLVGENYTNYQKLIKL